MKIVCRTVTGAATEHEVEPTETVGGIKQKMSSEYDLASLRLCHKGKVLDDSKSMQDLGFNDGEVLIIAGKKVKPGTAAPAPAAAEAKPAEARPAPAQPPAEQAQQASPNSQSTSSQPPAQAPSTSTPAAATSAAPDESGVDASTIEMIMSMGFDDRPKVVHALRCAYGNGDRAVEYLCSGIPAGVEAQFRQQQAARAAPPASTPQRQAPSGGSSSGANAPSGGGGPMSAEALGQMMAQMQGQQQGGSELRRALMGIPQFEQIRALVRQNSAALPTVMQQLAEHHPGVFQLVQASPQEFLDIINEPPARGGAAPAGAGGAEAQQQEQLPSLGPEDQPAIERLVALGGGQWDARAASLVYMVCRKNEELAANVLFDNGGLPPELLQALADGAMMGGDGDEEDDDADA